MTDKPNLTSYRDLRASRPVDEDNVAALKRGLEFDIALTRLREDRGVTQMQVAEHLATSRPNVSRIERENDVRVSTLRRYVEALGGEIEIVARFPDGNDQVLTAATKQTP